MRKKKVATKDFDINSLPKNRKEQFKDIFKHNLVLLIEIGVLLLLFLLPMLASIVVKDSSLLIAYTSGYSEEKIYEMEFSTKLIQCFVFAVTVIIAGIGISGVMNIFKRLIYSEPVFFWHDFKDGIKKSFKETMIIALFIALFSCAGNILYLVLNVKVVGYIVLGINYALIYPLCFVSLFLTNTYKNTLLVNIKTAFILYIKFFPFVILFYLSLFAPTLIKLIPLSVYFIKYIIFILYVLLIYPTATLGSFLYFTNLFDEHINKTQFPEFYRKGLFNNYKE